MKRQVVSLDGNWTVVFDEKNVGRHRKYFERLPAGQPLAVPGVWELVRPGYDGVGWYATTFEAEARWLLSRAVRLRFGAVNYYCDVFVNGRKVGSHEGGYTPFELDVTAALVAGENILTVRVINPPKRKVIEGFRTGAPLSQSDIPTWKAGWYYNFGGIWQSVSLIVTDRVYIKDVFVEPLPDLRTAKVHVTVVGRKGVVVDLAADVVPAKGDEKTGGAATATARLKRRETVVTLTVKVRAARLWDTEDPFLYRADVTLVCPGGDDALSVRFGLRTFTVRGNHCFLNNKRIVLKGVLQQGVYPRQIAIPTPELIRQELALVKKNGMNYIRLHLKPDPHALDLMDEMGLLACGEPPLGWIARSPQITRRCLQEVEGLVTRDRNHPSVIFWALLNETYHYRSFTWRQIDKLRRSLSSLARDLDPSRLIGDSSGGGADYGKSGGALMPYRRTYSPFRDLHQYCPLPLQEESLETRYRNLPHQGGPVYISEFGAFECPPDYERTLARYSAADRKIGLEDYVQYRDFYESLKEQFKLAGLADTFGDVRALIRRIDERCGEEVRAVVGAIRTNVDLGGYAICQMADASGEIFGVTDIWRQPKKYFTDFAAAAAVPYLVPHVRHRVLEPGGAVELELYCVNEHLTGLKYIAEITVRELSSGRAVGKLAKSFTGAGWVQTVVKSKLAAPKKPGRYVVDSLRFTVVEQTDVAGTAVRVIDMRGEVADLLSGVGVKVNTATNNSPFKDQAFFIHGRAHDAAYPPFEQLLQIARQVRLGGVAVLLQPATPMFYGDLLPWPLRLLTPMRTMGYVREHPIFEGLPTGVVDYEYSRLLVGTGHEGLEVKQVGGTSILGGIGAHMWTKPDKYLWASFVDELPLGRGKIISVHLDLLGNAGGDVAARRILRNLVAYATRSIRPGLEDRCVGRYMDPITAP